jgi:hypothetical protein
MLGKVPARAALDAHEFAVGRRLGITLGVDDVIAFRPIVDAATHAAVAADGLLVLEFPFAALLEARDRQQRGGRANLHAASAEHAVRVGHRHVEGRGDMAAKAPIDDLDGMRADDLVAYPHALGAQDAVLVIADEEGVVGLIQRARELEIVAGLGDAVVVGVFLQ